MTVASAQKLGLAAEICHVIHLQFYFIIFFLMWQFKILIECFSSN